MNIQRLYQLYKCLAGYKSCDYQLHYYYSKGLVKINDLANQLDCNTSSPVSCALYPVLKSISYGASIVAEMAPVVATITPPTLLLIACTHQPLLALGIVGVPTALYAYHLWSSYDNTLSFLMAHDVSPLKEGEVYTSLKIDLNHSLIAGRYENTVFHDIVTSEENNELIIDIRTISQAENDEHLADIDELHAAILRQLYAKLENARGNEQKFANQNIGDQDSFIEIQMPPDYVNDFVNPL